MRYWLCRCLCGLEKEVGQRQLVSGRSSCCRKCSGKKNSLRAKQRSESTNGLYKHPGISGTIWWKEVRKQQFDKQNGICPICLRPLDKLAAFDHDHQTGFCRALVHRGCNVLIGFAENHPGIFERVKSYISYHKEKVVP